LGGLLTVRVLRGTWRSGRHFWSLTMARFSAAEMLQTLLGIEAMPVEGPVRRNTTDYAESTIARAVFERAKTDTVDFIRTNQRLPAEVWIGSRKLSLQDFAATLGADDGASPAVAVRKGNPEMEKYITTDATGSFSWPIHPEGFSAPQLLELDVCKPGH